MRARVAVVGLCLFTRAFAACAFVPNQPGDDCNPDGCGSSDCPDGYMCNDNEHWTCTPKSTPTSSDERDDEPRVDAATGAESRGPHS